MNEEKRLCVWCEYARDREDIAGVYCTGGFCNPDGTCGHFKEYGKQEDDLLSKAPEVNDG